MTSVWRIGGVRGASALAAAGALAAAFAVAVLPADAAVSGVVRVDQVGYLAGESKQAYLMASAPASGAQFTVLDSAGTAVLSGAVGATSRGSWNTAYPAVHPISFDGLTRPGTYRIQVSGGASATSPRFKILDPAGLYGQLVADGVTFFQTQRDGRRVIPGALGRRPAHRGDAEAGVYRTPRFKSEDVIADDDLTKIGGPVDVEGGWYDAGDYLKFTHSTAYATAVLYAAERALGSVAPSTLGAEADFGADWLNKAWDESSRTLYLQVGIGAGNAAGTFTGDHDLWRLPQDDDANTSGADRYATAHRPVFQAAEPGAKISPNLAGRVSAAFALAAQVNAERDKAKAAAAFRAATSVYAQAAIADPPSPLVTALPNDFYPERTWHDDMEFGAAEIALAAQKLDMDASAYLADAARFARGYLDGATGDTFNLYDTSALAHADLLEALHIGGSPPGLAVTGTALLADLKRQLAAGAARAASDVFRAGGDDTASDVASHTFGLLTTEALYRRISGDTSFAAVATQQRNWLLGANAWGTSFMIGEGATFPRCPHHQIFNLRTGTTGRAPVLTGAVVNGPTDLRQFSGSLGEHQTGMVRCQSTGNPFSSFTGHGSRYVDDVRSWQTSEPAIDMTGSAVIGAALQQAATKVANGGGEDTVTLSASTVSVAPDGSASLAVTAATKGPGGPLVTLAVTGMPEGVAVGLTPVVVLAGNSAKMSLSALPTAAPGTYTLTVTATSVGQQARTAALKLIVG
ncbi:glycoside hydrolase family 9 protein [Planosporangium flavigriseum]|uniref:Hydrolase n=1 Tax=Planosporangium flavigriseum TaxID=373681 RepID=A0A8J3LI30_9ACTN|nr:glycoside hydrolase family 9 protein [Planosporangium flavigriseum]GIG73688.1 hydrolase [Planosporangium flavigriseum]